MKVRHLFLTLGIVSVLAACGGGGGGATGSNALPAIATPTPGVVVSPGATLVSGATLPPGVTPSPGATLAPGVGASPGASALPGVTAAPGVTPATGTTPATGVTLPPDTTAAPGTTPVIGATPTAPPPGGGVVATPLPSPSAIVTVAPTAAPVVTPTPIVVVPTPMPTPPPTPTVAPTPQVLTLATGFPIGIDGGSLDPREIGTVSAFPNNRAYLTAPYSNGAYNAMDVGNGESIPAEYNINENGRHLHTHITLINAAGQRVVFPQGVGMFGDPAAPLRDYTGFSLDQFTAGGTGGTYFLHTHDHTGFIHAEDDTTLAQYGIRTPAQYTLGHVLKLMGETADATHFTRYLQGNVHVYLSRVYVISPSGPHDASNEIQTAPVEWKGDPFAIPAVAADDFGKIPLQSLEEITVEIGDTYYPVPRYYFPWYWCQSQSVTGQTDCTLDAPPAGVQAAAVMQRMPSSIGPRI